MPLDMYLVINLPKYCLVPSATRKRLVSLPKREVALPPSHVVLSSRYLLQSRSFQLDDERVCRLLSRYINRLSLTISIFFPYSYHCWLALLRAPDVDFATAFRPLSPSTSIQTSVCVCRLLSQSLPSSLSRLLLRRHHGALPCRPCGGASRARLPMGPGKARSTTAISPSHRKAWEMYRLAPTSTAEGGAISAQAEEHGAPEVRGVLEHGNSYRGGGLDRPEHPPSHSSTPNKGR